MIAAASRAPAIHHFCQASNPRPSALTTRSRSSFAVIFDFDPASFLAVVNLDVGGEMLLEATFQVAQPSVTQGRGRSLRRRAPPPR